MTAMEEQPRFDNLDAWLTTLVARVCANRLRSRCHGPGAIAEEAEGASPEHEALLAESVVLALFVALEELDPAERLAFVLHNVFAVPFDQIAPLLDRWAR